MRVETKVNSTLKYEGKIIKVTLDEVEIEGGIQAFREVAWHNGAVCILADIDDKVILVEQFRYPLSQKTWEIPAGKLEKGEQPLNCAIRELAEETGFLSEDLTEIFAFYSAPGFTNEYIRLYRARNLQQTNDYKLDEDEFVNIGYFSKQEAQKMLNEQKIIDAKTIIALQFWLNER